MTQDRQRDQRKREGTGRDASRPQSDGAVEATQPAEDTQQRDARNRLLDSVLDGIAGDTETIGTQDERPELRDRGQADEEYVRTFKQTGGE